jgi:hypothetical protein
VTTLVAVRWRTAAERWLFGLLLGAGAGLLVLGVGGRIAMRAIAIANGVPPGFTIGGTATVVFLGAANGGGGGVLYALLYRLLPRSRLLRGALFAVALVLLTLRGLRPVQPLALEWFMPLALVYGAIVDVAYTAWYRRLMPANGTRYSGRA